MVRKTTAQPWSPSSEIVEAIGLVQCSHWAASHDVPRGPYWARPTSWLNRQAARLAGGMLFARKLTI